MAFLLFEVDLLNDQACPLFTLSLLLLLSYHFSVLLTYAFDISETAVCVALLNSLKPVTPPLYHVVFKLLGKLLTVLLTQLLIVTTPPTRSFPTSLSPTIPPKKIHTELWFFTSIVVTEFT